MAPIIITLAIDQEAQCLLDALRQRHFPPARNLIDAHITLFHALDGAREKEIIRDVGSLEEMPYHIEADGLRSLGRGVAISISSGRLLATRAELAMQWTQMLTPQDRERFRPHVTIQNKVQPSEAEALLTAWRETFSPFTIMAIGIMVWRYLGGPWERIEFIPFGSTAIRNDG